MGAFDEQIAAQPAAVEALLRVEVPALDPARPIVLTGIGTSLHACRVAASWATMLTGGRIRPVAVEAHELALQRSITAADQIVVVTHRGTKRYPNEVLRQGRSLAATTIAITGHGAPEPDTDFVLRTCDDETSSTHTVSYVAALTMLGRLLSAIDGVDEDGALSAALRAVPEAQRRTLAGPAPDLVARRLAAHSPLLITGSGLDAITADEAALKYKEGTYRWAEGMSVEVALHGTPAAFASPMAAICVRPAHDDGGRTSELARLLAAVGVAVVGAGDGPDDDLRFAPVPVLARPLVAIVALQRLVASVARLVGSSPETTRADEEPWASAIGEIEL